MATWAVVVLVLLRENLPNAADEACERFLNRCEPGITKIGVACEHEVVRLISKQEFEQ